MTRTTLLLLLTVAVAVGLVGCGYETTPTVPAPDQAPDEHGHDHGDAPHGGHVAVLGDHTAHLEVAHGDGGELVLYALDADMKVVTFDDAPVLNLMTDEGSVALKGVAREDGGWTVEHDALLDHDVKGRFRLTIAGKTYTSEYEACDHGHGDCAHGPHDGTLAAFHDADGKPRGTLELKLHDDKGDLELWLVAGDAPIDVPLDTAIHVVFRSHADRKVALAPRNRTTNEDEDGVANLRDGKTNYFIFPGDTGADAGWLVGADFESEVVVSFTSAGVTYTSDAFALRPHTHSDHDHGHDDHAGHDDDHGHDDHDDGHEDDHHEGHE